MVIFGFAKASYIQFRAICSDIIATESVWIYWTQSNSFSMPGKAWTLDDLLAVGVG